MHDVEECEQSDVFDVASLCNDVFLQLHVFMFAWNVQCTILQCCNVAIAMFAIADCNVVYNKSHCIVICCILRSRVYRELRSLYTMQRDVIYVVMAIRMSYCVLQHATFVITNVVWLYNIAFCICNVVIAMLQLQCLQLQIAMLYPGSLWI